MSRPIGNQDQKRAAADTKARRRAAITGWIGLFLVAVVWPLNWWLPGPRTHLLFFPLWVGFVLCVDTLVAARSGQSVIHAAPLRFAGLFLASIPLWWIFEVINKRTQNWSYQGTALFSDVEYVVLASVAFSTVVPAILASAELVNSFGFMRRFADSWKLPGAGGFARILFASGWIMLALLLVWPDRFYPLVWGSLYAMMDPINYWRGRPSLLSRLHRGDWRPIVALSCGALICGFFWEMWNYFAFPRWIYRTPGVGAPYVFEMPLAGYLGYLPFAWEVYAFSHLVISRMPPLTIDDDGKRRAAPAIEHRVNAPGSLDRQV